MNVLRHCLIILISVVDCSVWLLATDRPWTIDAIMALKTISDPQINPDGSKVAYVVRAANFQRKSYDSQIWIDPRKPY